MGVMAAFIFAAQMINFPVAGGTSGHLLGGALAAIVLGPWAGMLVMTAVIAVQALLLQDGGLLVMEANGDNNKTTKEITTPAITQPRPPSAEADDSPSKSGRVRKMNPNAATVITASPSPIRACTPSMAITPVCKLLVPLNHN